MVPRLLIGSGIAASAIAHLSVLALIIVFAEVHPFGTVTAEPITVDIVSAEEAAPKKSEPLPPPSETPPVSTSSEKPPSFEKPAPPSPPAATATQQAASQPAQQAPPVSRPSPQSNSQQASVQPPPPASPPLPAAIPQEPDLAVKYHVRLGLPDNGPNGGFDTAAFKPAAIPVDDTAAFRNHLRKCSTLPQSVAPSDKISIKLRVSLMPDGKLAAEPVLIEASASPKGPVLMQSAIVALMACQPYAMLPAEKYNEWRVLDLNFTPQDFTGG